MSTKSVTSSNIDIILEIQAVLKTMKRKVKFEHHVKAHQAHDTPCEALPSEVFLSIDIDRLAELQHDRPIDKYKIKMPHLNAQIISFSSLSYFRLGNRFLSKLID